MSLLSFIQDKILLPRKWKQYKKNRPTHQFVSLKNAKKVAIITDFRDPGLIRIVSDFHKKIKKEELSISLAAIVQEERSNFNQFEFERQFPGSLVYLIASDEVNRWGQAKKILFQPFLNDQYDIIFFLDLTPSFTIYDIILSTTSRMVAGRTGDTREIVDFGIELDITSPLETLTDNLYKYLISIKEPKAVSETEQQFNKEDPKLF